MELEERRVELEGTILVIEDEKAISDILCLNLRAAGFRAVCAYDGETGLREALSLRPDLILLDVMLPGLDGFSVCKQFREVDKLTPIIMLTARDEERDMIFGLEHGADDYMTKPFSVRELLARVRTNIRRRSIRPAQMPQVGVQIGRFVLDHAEGFAYKDGKRLDLTQREFQLLAHLTSAAGKVFSREALMQEVWQYDYLGDLRTVDVAVRRLREKVEEDPANPKCILTKRGVGYFILVDAAGQNDAE